MPSLRKYSYPALKLVGRFPLLGAALGMLLCSGILNDAHAQKFSKVVIDPGHGGKDGGSKWYGITEKNLTLDLAKRIQKALQAHGVTCVLTRKDDTYVELIDRAEKANTPKTIFVSVHFNAHTDRSIKGIETFYYPGSSESRLLAGYIQSELGRRIRTRNRGVKPGRLKVLQKTKGTAVLVECGFISNRWESQRCAASWFRQILAEEIAQGIMRYR